MKAYILFLLIALLQAHRSPAQVHLYSEKCFNRPDAPVHSRISDYISYDSCTFNQPPKDPGQSSTAWTAPKGTITDWASIPIICLPFIGLRDDKRWRKAALIHDAYCGDSNKLGASYQRAPWQQVHRMFRDACLSGGTPKTKANIMFAAVYLYGTRNKWVSDNGVPRKVKYADGQKNGATAEEKKAANLDLTMIPVSSQKQQMNEIGRFVEARAHAGKGLIEEPYNKTLDSVAYASHRNRVVPSDTIATYYSFYANEQPQLLVPSKEYLLWQKRYADEVARYEHSYAGTLAQKYVNQATENDKNLDLSTVEGLKEATEARKELRKLHEKGPKMPGKPIQKAAGTVKQRPRKGK